MIALPVMKLMQGKETDTFKARYESLAGLEIPNDYLKKSRVYGFYQNKELVGGFMLSTSTERLRTIELFIAPGNRREVYSELSDLSLYTEVCCFWMERRIRKKKMVNILIWLKMAYQISREKNPIILYGTQSKGLAYLYGLPKVSTLFRSDVVNALNSYVFLTKRNEFVKGAWEMVFCKLLQRNRPKVLTNYHSPTEIIAMHR
ncbi:hypothetical protein QQ020_34895 [Fulvivirgaceae bacterium BMA12]|uniref:Uncharacterized protein n=1 Tax=Agaribacillus aureus TaxID=3051825 RepID=A0ABT8LHN0_9BACT|nr:hypothetical protein [Fulvivirgaceae bacterium BMA12]